MAIKTKYVTWRQRYWTVLTIVLLLTSLSGAGITEGSKIKQPVNSTYPVEKVGVIARSITFPQVLNQGRIIIGSEHPNASVLCMNVANYSGLVTGLIWSMDREMVEEHRLQYLIDRADKVFLTCVVLFIADRQTLHKDHKSVGQKSVNRGAIAASAEINEELPVLSMEEVRQAIVAQIEEIQEILRLAQSIESQSE